MQWHIDFDAARAALGENFTPTPPTCAVCGAGSRMLQESLLHPEPRAMCWPCAKAEVAACERAEVAR